VEDIRRAQEFPSLESLFDAEEEYHLTNIEIYCCVADEKIDPFADWAFPLSREVDGEEPGAPGFA